MKTTLFRILAGISLLTMGSANSLLGQTFTNMDVGTPALPGYYTNNPNGSITVRGGGDDIFGAADNFHYYYTSVTGLVWDARVQMIGLEGPDFWSKGGLMARRASSTNSFLPAANDPEIMVLVTRTNGQNDVQPQYRGTRGGNTSQQNQTRPPRFPNQWLRMTRSNTVFTVYSSTNGTDWQTFAPFTAQDTALATNTFDGSQWEDPILVGIAVTAHNNGDLTGATCTFSNLSVTILPTFPPTQAGVVTQIQNTAAYEYAEASFRFVATNNANPNFYTMNYSWYKNNQLVSTNPMGPDYTFLTTPADSGAQIYAIGRAQAPYESVAATSSVATLTLNTGSLLYTNGLKRERFAGRSRQQVNNWSTGPGIVDMVSEAQSPGGFGENYTARYSGWFIPPASDLYVFFVAADDDTDLFLSTDSHATNKVLIAQETGYSGALSWVTPSGGGSSTAMKRSDQWTNSLGAVPFANGIPLTAGNMYYIEAVHHNGGGGDNFAITFQTTNAAVATPLVGGEPTMLSASNQNIVLATYPGTFVSISQNPTNLTVFEGQTANFYGVGTSDSEMTVAYQWLVNDAPYPGATSTNLSLPLVGTNLNAATIKLIASTREGGFTSTSSVATLTVLQSVWEPGFIKVERFGANSTRQQVNNGTAGSPIYTMAVPSMEVGLANPGNIANFARRISGYFLPAVTDNYDFYVNGDDDTDLFISTNDAPANKYLIAQQELWSNPLNWQTAGAGSLSQKRSDQWTNATSGGAAPFAGGITLSNGQRYYVETVFHQGGGGANVAATWSYTFTEDIPANGTRSRFKGNFVGINAIRCYSVTFTQQPTNITVGVGSFAAFRVAGATDSTLIVGGPDNNEESYTNSFLLYQWQKNGVDIPGANAATLNYGPLLDTDSGAQFSCRMRALGYADNSLNRLWVTSSVATATVTGQMVFEPGVAKVEWWTNNNNARLTILDGSAGSPAYTYTTPKFIAPDVSVADNYGNRVSGWFIAPQTGSYSFFLNADRDTDVFVSTNSDPMNKFMVCREDNTSGGVLQWQGGDLFNQRYSDQFVNPVYIALLFQYGIPMEAGQKYYIEAVHRDTVGGDYMALTYTLYGAGTPANNTDTALQGNVIGFYAPRISWVGFTEQPTSQVATSGASSVTFSCLGSNTPSIVVGTTGNPLGLVTNATASATNQIQYQWYKNNQPISNATSRSYTLSPILPADNGADFYCAIRAIGYANDALQPIWTNSQTAELTVITETNKPSITYAATFENTNFYATTFMTHMIVNVTFDEWMNPATVTNPANYTIVASNSPINVTNVTIAANNRTVQLWVDALPTPPMSVIVNGAVTDLSGNGIQGGTTTNTIMPELLTFSDVGTPGLNPIGPTGPTIAYVTGSGAYRILAQGRDIWDAQDGFNFAWEMKTNDFDVVVRQVSAALTQQYAKGGLMVRETLDNNSRNWSVVNDPPAPMQNAVEANMRTQTGSNTVNTFDINPNARPVPAYPNAWVRIKRAGSVLTAYRSSDGANWELRGTYNTTNAVPEGLTNVVYVGLATTSHLDGTYHTVEYDGYNSSFVPMDPAQLTITKSGTDAIISWAPGGGRLESTLALGTGASWTTVTTNNPATNAIGSGTQFFRVVKP